MLHYILQTVIFQLLFLLIYDVFLKKETFFTWNRFYLLVSAFLSIVLPFIKIDSFKTAIPLEYIYVLPEVIIGNANNKIVAGEAVIYNVNVSGITLNWSYVLYLGCVIALILFALKLYKLITMAYKNPKIKLENAFLVELANSKHAFSFFNYIFLGKDINTEDRQSILTHELQHVKEKHSLDLLFFEILKIIFWFNPVIYMYQKRIADLHEFTADAKAVKSSNKANYYQNLLSQVFDTQKVSFINPFFKQSLIKKRIIMLNKSKSKQIHLAKYLLLFPMVIGMLFYTSCSAYQEENSNVLNSLEQYSYSMKLGDKMTSDIKGIHERYEAFLKENKNYVSWSVIDENTELISYSVHIKDEERPMKMEETKVRFQDGTSYTSYFNFNNVKRKQDYKDLAPNNTSSLTVDQFPLYPGCDESASNVERRKCFSQSINRLVFKNFNLDLGKSLGLKGKQKIYSNFKINEEGNIVDVKASAEHPKLEEEIRRVISLIPQLIPGKKDGKAVNVAYELPVTFNIQE